MAEGRIVVIGAGPAGLAAALVLARGGRPPLVLEAGARPGGLARTEEHAGFLFDMGGHRFFTRLPDVEGLWRSLLGPDLRCTPRLSRIFYRGRFFAYPLRPLDALAGLGPLAGLALAASYAYWRLFPYREEQTFEQWVTNRFGRRLYLAFFKSYTEKVWGIPCSELRADWAVQRIQGLSLRKAFAGPRSPGRPRARTLIDQFLYPRRGPGMLWERAVAEIEARGGKLALGARAVGVGLEGGRVASVAVQTNHGLERTACADLITSMPIPALIAALEPRAPEEVRRAASGLRFRGFLTVCLIAGRERLFPDQWIYVHDPEVRMGRLQNYRNWSPEMCPEPGRTGLGLEYFCDRGDAFWNMADSDLAALGKAEADALGLVPAECVERWAVFRIPEAYPVYDSGYRARLAALRSFLDPIAGLRTIGRSGLFRYNNMDHSMATGMMAAENLLDGGRRDVWRVGEGGEYLESAGGGACT